MATPIAIPIQNPELDETERAQLLARRYRSEFVDLKNFKIQHELFRTVPVELMFRYNFVPLEQQDGRLVIAVSDPSRLMVLDEDLAAARQLLDEQIVEARHVFGEDAFDQEVFDDDEDDGPSILVHRRTRLLRWGVMLLAAAFLAPLIVALVD